MRSTLLAITALLAVGFSAPTFAVDNTHSYMHRQTVAGQQRDWNTCYDLAKARGFNSVNDGGNSGMSGLKFVIRCMKDASFASGSGSASAYGYATPRSHY